MKPISTEQKRARYQRLYAQLEALLIKSPNDIAKMATIAAVLYHKTDYFFWCGFYFLESSDLWVGPYQGPVACQVLPAGKGVCHASLKQQKPLLIPDVHLFPDHIACDSRSQSEVVIPFVRPNGSFAVLDVDSDQKNAFDLVDLEELQKIVSLIS